MYYPGEEHAEEHNFYYEPNLTIYLEDAWLIFSGLINIVSCIIIISTLLKVNSKGHIHFFLITLTSLDLIHQLFCPPFYIILLNISSFFTSFLVYKKFICMYFAAIFGQMLILLTLLLRNEVKLIRKYYIYTIGVNCLLVVFFVIIGHRLFENAFRWRSFVEFQVIGFFLLFVSTFIQQLADIVKLGKEHSQDYKTSMVVLLAYVTIRVIFVIVMAITIIFSYTLAEEAAKAKIYMGFIQLNSIVNIFILNYTDDQFKSCLYKVLSLGRLRRNNAINFVNLPPDTMDIMNEN